MLLLREGWREGARGAIHAGRQAGSKLLGRGCRRAGPGEGLRGDAAAQAELGRPGSARSAARRAVALRRRRPRPAGAEEGPETGAAGGSCLRDDCRQRGDLSRQSRGPRRLRLSRLSSFPSSLGRGVRNGPRPPRAPHSAPPVGPTSRRLAGRPASHNSSPHSQAVPTQIPGKKMRETGPALSSQSSSSSGRGRVFRRFLSAARTRWQRPRRGAEPGLGGAAC